MDQFPPNIQDQNIYEQEGISVWPPTARFWGGGVELLLRESHVGLKGGGVPLLLVTGQWHHG